MKSTITFEAEFDIEVEVDYRPERPAPDCRNPSSPAYADPGDDEICDVEKIYAVIGKEKVELPAKLGEWLIDTIRDYARAE